MAAISLVGALVVTLGDAKQIMTYGFFKGYDSLVASVILLQVLGGLLTAVVVKYTDSIVKGFAMSGSIILSCVLSSALVGDLGMTLQFFYGTSTVIASALSYSYLSLNKGKQGRLTTSKYVSIAREGGGIEGIGGTRGIEGIGGIGGIGGIRGGDHEGLPPLLDLDPSMLVEWEDDARYTAHRGQRHAHTVGSIEQEADEMPLLGVNDISVGSRLL